MQHLHGDVKEVYTSYRFTYYSTPVLIIVIYLRDRRSEIVKSFLRTGVASVSFQYAS